MTKFTFFYITLNVDGKLQLNYTNLASCNEGRLRCIDKYQHFIIPFSLLTKCTPLFKGSLTYSDCDCDCGSNCDIAKMGS